MTTNTPISDDQHVRIATGSTYAGLFLVSLATLMYEIHLTRIFSVTMWYHFAFMAVSLAMFGMTAGALVVYRLRAAEDPANTLAMSALLFASTIVASFLIHLSLPFHFGSDVESIALFGITFSTIAVPFVFSGICICIALTRFPSQTSKLYAADLAGAACGCIFLVALLEYVDGVPAVLVIAVLACLGAWFFARDCQSARMRTATLITGLCLAGLALSQAFLYQFGAPLVRLHQAKLGREACGYEKWNSFARICVWGDPLTPHRPIAWGLSPAFPADKLTRQLIMSIDAAAWTPLNFYDGTAQNVEHLKYDVTNMVHNLRPDSRVLVVGVGGGRDIVSALIFNQKSVLGVEINEDILDALNIVFGEYTGHLDEDPRVSFENDEARSYVTRSRDLFDIIQISLTDTWAATSSGAFCLTENSLYTVEAFQSMLEHLTPTGVLTLSRWYHGSRPAEMYRLTALATEALKRIGITDTGNHIIIVGNVRQHRGQLWPDGIGTLLVSRQPFTAGDLKKVSRQAREMRFDVVLTPEQAIDDTFASLASAKDAGSVIAEYPLNLAPPTDDSPYFFNMLRLQSMFDRRLWQQGIMSFNTHAVVVLGSSLIVTVLLSLLTMVVPLSLLPRGQSWKNSATLMMFFASIGLGFMFIEISQMQRLIVFLGHPVYGLTVLLFTLLLSSSLGSLATANMSASSGNKRLFLLLCVLAVFGLSAQPITQATQMAPTSVRILEAVVMLFPVGFGMGMAFPIGMSLAKLKTSSLMPWFWAVNGAMSVCGSVAAVALALASGISSVFWAGTACYAIALLSYALALRSSEAERAAAAARGEAAGT